MTLDSFHLFDLPNEIWFLILKKLDNMDVLYSLLGINNRELNDLVQDKAFTSILSFVSMSSADDICSISGRILDRFCLDILPKIHYNVKCLVLDSISMEAILLAGNYPTLREIQLFNFNQEILSRCFIGKKLVRSDLFKD